MEEEQAVGRAKESLPHVHLSRFRTINEGDQILTVVIFSYLIFSPLFWHWKSCGILNHLDKPLSYRPTQCVGVYILSVHYLPLCIHI